ncbi:hypothetical protein BaRGS_00034489 [Batillaria attramentaria]|uniref:Uncharacterized protein n=1 Tax=Batillaria attramentaria TaxID=370345 RepID=A0ABD0JHA5_9CAEN
MIALAQNSLYSNLFVPQTTDCPPLQSTHVDCQVEEDDDTSPTECVDIVLVSDVDLDLDILDRDLFLSDTSSEEGDTLELETLYNDLAVSDTSSEEDERPDTVEQSSDDSSGRRVFGRAGEVHLLRAGDDAEGI